MNIYEGHISGDKPVIIDFCAEWCAPGKMMEPILRELKEKVGEMITVLRVDIDKEPGLKKLYDIRTVPTLVIIKHGNVIWRKNGMASAHEIMEHINTALLT